jgi:hypothetical protein
MSHHLEKQNRKRGQLSQTFCVTDDEKIYGIWGEVQIQHIPLPVKG